METLLSNDRSEPIDETGNPVTPADLEEDIVPSPLDGVETPTDPPDDTPDDTFVGSRLAQVRAGLDELLGKLDTAIDEVVFAENLPLVGDRLKDATDPAIDFLTDAKEKIDSALDGVEDSPDKIREALYEALGSDGLDWLRDLNNDGNITIDDLEVEDTADNLQFNFKLGTQPDTGVNVPLGANLGLPGLSLGIEGEAQAKLGFEFDVRFGVRGTEEVIDPPTEPPIDPPIDPIAPFEFYFDAERENEITLDLKVSTPDLEATGSLGFLQVEVSDEDADDNPDNDGEDADGDGIAPTQFSSTFAVDIQDADGDDADDRVTLEELTNIEVSNLIDSSLTGDTQINLNFRTSFADSVKFPSLETDFNVAWAFANGDSSEPNIAFNNVQLDLGSFIGSFAQPILETAQKITDIFPLNKVLGILNDEIPVLNARLIDAAETFGFVNEETQKFLDIISDINEIIEVINSIPVDGENAIVDFGDFLISGSNPITKSLRQNSAIAPLKANDTSNQAQNDFIDVIEGTPSLEFPILTEPEKVIPALLLGDSSDAEIDLFRFNLPTLGLGFEYESPPIPIFGPLSAVIIGQAGAAASIGFGYDIYGLQQFRDNEFSNPDLIAKGFYVTAPDEPNPPPPLDDDESFIFGIGAGIVADVGIELGVIRASVDAGVSSNIYVDLAEERTRIEDFENPGCLFELEGSFDATLGAKLRIGFGPFSFSKRIEIVRQTLADFRAGCSEGSGEDQGQAVVRENQLILETSDDNDAIEITNISGEAEVETVDVTAYTVEEVIEDNRSQKELLSYKDAASYSDFDIIVGDGKNGNDRIELNENVRSSASLKGGNGDDELFGGKGNDTLDGGNADFGDALFGGEGNDSLFGNNGDDFLQGGKGQDTLNGGDGNDAISYVESSSAVNINLVEQFVFDGEGDNDVLIDIEQIDGSNHNDSIVADEDNNIIDGLEGDDRIFGGDGDDFIIGGIGADILDGGDENEGDGTSYIASPAPVIVDLTREIAFQGEAEGDRLISIEHILGTRYGDRITGNQKKNHLNGSRGDDTLRGEAGSDTLEGGVGDDWLSGGAGADTLDGGGYRNDSPGKDWVSYNQSPEGVNVSLKTGNGSGGDADGDKLLRAKQLIRSENPEEIPSTVEETEFSSFENLEGSSHNDVLEGDAGRNILVGLDNNDTLRADEANDTLVGGAGADFLDGGGSLDWSDYSESPEAVTVSLAANLGIGGHAQGDIFEKIGEISTVENLLGSDFADVLVGDDGSNEIDPGLANGTDVVNGLGGSDRLRIDYSQRDIGTGIIGGFDSGSFDSGFLARNTSDDSSILDAVDFSNIEHLQLIGTIQNDEIYGGPGNDILLPGAGDDTIYGGRGSNTIRADDGNDIVVDLNDINRNFAGTPDDSLTYLDGGRGIDTLSIDLSGKQGNIFLESTNPFQENSNQFFSIADGTASITNFEVFEEIETGSGRDRLTQLGRVDNRFSTGMGADIVNPGLGFDVVDGGSAPLLLLSEPLTLPLTFDSSLGLGATLEFTKLEGVAGNPDNPLTAVYRADLSDIGFDLNSISIADDGTVSGGATGPFSGFDFDSIKISNTLITEAEDIDTIPGLDVFNFSPSGTFLTPGSQRFPSEPGQPDIAPDLFGTIDGAIDNSVATLGSFDATANIDNPDGFASLGDEGQIGFNLTNTVSTTDKPLYLYIGEAGNNEQIPGGQITVSSTSIIPLAAHEDLLVLDFSIEDTGTGVFYSQEDVPQIFDNTELDFNSLPYLVNENAANGGVYARSTADETSILDRTEFSNFERFNITGTSQDDGLVGGDSHDILVTGAGNDVLIGRYGSDVLDGGDGDDILVSSLRRSPSFEIDTLTGGAGGDRFWLGTTNCSYDDSNITTPGSWDYGRITDFNPAEGDVIHLAIVNSESPNNGYTLADSPIGLPTGTAIYREDELIGIVEGVTDLSLDETYFSFSRRPCDILL
ncbi:MAG: hypothetical protein SWY16_25790 [Cyanobacteriota bacterium]|nr:hypothetical protein [Cyanobacteriota bacterium]